ncbi:CobW family GTP-binding protein [Rubritalea tangerina]|uniref:CobW family GTP-binding protein n=1 Tax=Rubritalea tangerina TaxID=430798 RepID=A0ABW4Z7S5_9BACT
MSKEPIPIVSLCGFLGSGKTTLLRRWQREESLKEAPLIVHDLSDFGLDAELLSDSGSSPAPGSLKGRVAALHGSHARENLHTSVAKVLKQISSLRPPLVLCESTGAARPWPLIKALTQSKHFYLRHFIVTIDALNLHRDFNDGRDLTESLIHAQDPALRQVAHLLAEQLAFASIIILTKTDTLAKPIVDAQVGILQTLQPRAAIGLSAQAGLLLPQLDGIPAPKLTELENKATQLGLTEQSATVENVEAEIFQDPRPFHPQRLFDACQNHLSTGLFRTKGFIWLASRPGHVLLWQQAGSQISLELKDLWRAEIVKNPDGKLLPEEIEHLQKQLESQHPIFGDRHNELTLIGTPSARESFAQALTHALCTDDEIAAWQKGSEFPDPWPSSIRQVR